MLKRPFTRRFSYSAGPQTLAVLSCALALLAVNPIAVKAAPSSPVPLTRVQGQMPESAPELLETNAVNTGPVSAAPVTSDNRKQKATAKMAASRHSAILQTVAFLNAALLGQLSPMTAQAVLPPVAQTFAAALAPAFPIASITNSPSSPPAYERTFAVIHCLLAPPV